MCANTLLTYVCTSTETKVWDVDERKRVMVLQGHEATVCSVVADEHKIVSGAADKVTSFQQMLSLPLLSA